MPSYLTQNDLENAITPQTVLGLFDDGTGTVNAPAVIDVCNRASAMVDSYLARVYKGPFPVVQTPYPEMIKVAALDFAIAYSFERRPDYVRTFGENPRAERWKRGLDMLERIADGLQELADFQAQPKQQTLGGIIYEHGPNNPANRTIIDGSDGTYNGGDF